MIMLPDRVNVTAGQAPPAHTLQDARTKLWYQCPDLGYAIAACATCVGPHIRCHSHYGLPFRWELCARKGRRAAQRQEGRDSALSAAGSGAPVPRWTPGQLQT
jgi:hypothetical protein